MFDAQAMGTRIRRLRQRQGLTQEQLSELLGLSVSFVGHIERGSRQTSLETLSRLTEVLQVSADYLLKGEEGILISGDQLQLLRDFRRTFDSSRWLEGLDEETGEEK